MITEATKRRYRPEILCNGRIRVFDYRARIHGSWRQDGTDPHGDLSYSMPWASVQALCKAYGIKTFPRPRRAWGY